jgi:hypothetical protein
MDKKAYTPPRIIYYPPDQVPETVIQLFLPKKSVPFQPGQAHRLRFFQGFVIVLTIVFLWTGGSLLHESISNPARQPWELLGGALLCSLALLFAYFLWKQRAARKTQKSD